MIVLLAVGLAVRLLVLMHSTGINPDRHFEVIQYIAESRTLPVSNLLAQSYHPPLYYLLMAPLYAWWPSVTPLHLASFVLSSLNLLLIFWLLHDPVIIKRDNARLIAFALTCFLPQAVMYGDFVSNDTLAMLVGTAVFGAGVAWLKRPDYPRLLALALLVGAGMLTKGAFILTGFALTLLIALRAPHRASMVTLFCAIWLITGSFKYVDNYIRVGRVIVHNKDVQDAIARSQRGTFKGWRTICDLNVIKLIRRPI